MADEIAFRIIYAAIGLGLIGLLFFFFSRKLDRKTYLIPVIIGFLFGTVTDIIMGGGMISLSLLLGGVLTGYFIKGVVSWPLLFRVGGLNGTLLLAVLTIVPTLVVIFTINLSDILELVTASGQTLTAEQLLYDLIQTLIIRALIFILIVGVGAILGSYLRRILKTVKHGSGASGSPLQEQITKNCPQAEDNAKEKVSQP